VPVLEVYSLSVAGHLRQHRVKFVRWGSDTNAMKGTSPASRWPKGRRDRSVESCTRGAGILTPPHMVVG